MAERVSSWHIAVAAEAFAAGLFARCGLDVSVQYGADVGTRAKAAGTVERVPESWRFTAARVDELLARA